MENGTNFTETLLQALQDKTQWYDSEALPEILENFRLLHTCVKNIFDFLVKKAVITPDPYKLEKKISDIVPPESSQFIENERSVIMGQRFSDYESVLDFLCNYYKFSVQHLTIPNIKKLVDLANSILWNSFTVNNNKINTRVLATIVYDARNNSDALTVSMVNDSLSKASRAQTEILSALKDFTDFQREYYKGTVRKSVICGPSFNMEKALESPAAEIAMIKKNFAAGLGKFPFYNELIDEIVQEDQGANKAELQKKTLEKLNIVSKKETKKENKIDTKAILMDAIAILGATPAQLMTILQKIQDNHDVLESEHNSFGDKLKRVFRKAFGLTEKPTIYLVTLVDSSTGAKRHEKIDYHVLTTDIATKSRRYAAAANKNSVGYKKILALPEEKILEFVSQQISECNKLMTILNGLDEYFKAAASPMNKSKIKGLKIDLTTLKNAIVKTNQHRAEYTAYIEEEAQMRKLGITQ